MIQINKRYAIRSGNNCITVCKSFMAKGEKEWRDIAYYGNIKQALDKIVDLAVLKGLDRGSWKAVVEEVAAARRDIEAISAQLNA